MSANSSALNKKEWLIQLLKQRQEVKQLKEELLGTKKYFILSPQCIEKAKLCQKQKVQYIELSEVYQKEISHCIKLRNQCMESERRKHQLELQQQYRDEVEWQLMLMETYLLELKQEQEYRQQIDEKEQYCSDLELHLQQMEQRNNEDLIEVLQMCQQELDRQMHVLNKLKLLCGSLRK